MDSSGSPAAARPGLLRKNANHSKGGLRLPRCLKEWLSPRVFMRTCSLRAPPASRAAPCQAGKACAAAVTGHQVSVAGPTRSGSLDGLDGEVGHLGPHAAREGRAFGDVIALLNLQAVRRLKHGGPLHQVEGHLHAQSVLGMAPQTAKTGRCTVLSH